MELLPVEERMIPLVASWLAKEENYMWLDFGHGSQPLDPMVLKVMLRKHNHLLRVFTKNEGGTPIGLVAFSDIHPQFNTAMVWYLLGDKAHGGKGLTTRAVSMLLGLGFRELGLGAVHAWVAEGNVASVCILESNRFRLIGRQRHCHSIRGTPCDRLLFDLLAEEYRAPATLASAASSALASLLLAGELALGATRGEHTVALLDLSPAWSLIECLL